MIAITITMILLITIIKYISTHIIIIIIIIIIIQSKEYRNLTNTVFGLH